MKISIVTINYNNAEGLRRTLESVAAQTYREIEHVIVDGASTDNSVEIIKDYVRRFEIGDLRLENVIWSSEKDNGIYNAMNKGVKKATGDYVFILNSGDALAAPNVIERMVAALNDASSMLNESLHSMSREHSSLNDGGIDILLGNIIHVYADGKSKKIDDRCIDDRLTPHVMDVSMLTFYSGTVPHDAAFVKRELFAQYGYFDEKMKICADWKLYLDMIALGGVQPWYVNIDVVLFDMSGISNTNNELRLAERRAYLEKVLPKAVLKDYDAYARPIGQYERLRKHHIWSLVTFIERVLFKLEKWHVLR